MYLEMIATGHSGPPVDAMKCVDPVLYRSLLECGTTTLIKSSSTMTTSDLSRV